MTEHPVRLVLTDDLRRSRLTVFFRLLLAIPHVIWAALVLIVVILVAIAGWFIVLVTGRLPAGLHGFSAGFVRYAIQVESYILLAANSYPSFYGAGNDGYPVDVRIAPPAPQSRWKTLFRLILALPAFALSSALGGGSGGGGRSRASFGSGGLAFAAAFLMWFYGLVTGRAPRGSRDLVGWSLGYSAQTWAYVLLLTDRYPYTGPEGHLPPLEEDDPEADHPVKLTVGDDLRRSRLLVFFRLPLAIPHIVWLVLWTIVLWIASIVAWIAAVAMGRPPTWFVRFASAYVRYTAHLSAFVWLAGNPFPGFVGEPGSYPVDVEVPGGGPQSRWRIFFRLPLAIPALILSGGTNGVLVVTGILGWFVALALARMPGGLRNAGAYSVGYGAQVASYVYLLTDRYPDSTPRRLLRL
jgi:hypothetical protein